MQNRLPSQSSEVFVVAAREVESSSTVEQGLPVSPSLGPALEAAQVPIEVMPVDRRVVLISLIAIGLAAVAAVVAQVLMHLIWFITGAAFHGRFSFDKST